VRLNRVIRASEWWEYKIAPVLAAFYGKLLLAGTPVSAHWRDALTLVLALVAEAVYVSVLNDLTDREIDGAAGKTPRGDSTVVPLVLLATSVGIGACVAWLWRGNPLLVAAYAAGWIAFTLYSLPPFRFKHRGLLGVVCDASGAHLFPTLTAILLVSDRDTVWLLATAAWSFASGIRGILWHQLRDADADVLANVQTFVVRRGAQVATRIATHVAFPIQLLALAIMLWQLRTIWPLVALAIHTLLMLLRPMRWNVRATIVTPGAQSFLALNEFDESWFPASILFASGRAHPLDFVVLAIHLLAFPRHTLQNVRELAGLVRLRRRARA
jgi:4-hydroxybenzoate polyprenyltransferase